MKYLLVLILALTSTKLLANQIITSVETSTKLGISGYMDPDIKELCYRGTLYFLVPVGYKGYMAPVYKNSTEVVRCKSHKNYHTELKGGTN